MPHLEVLLLRSRVDCFIQEASKQGWNALTLRRRKERYKDELMFARLHVETNIERICSLTRSPRRPSLRIRQAIREPWCSCCSIAMWVVYFLLSCCQEPFRGSLASIAWRPTVEVSLNLWGRFWIVHDSGVLPSSSFLRQAINTTFLQLHVCIRLSTFRCFDPCRTSCHISTVFVIRQVINHSQVSEAQFHLDKMLSTAGNIMGRNKTRVLAGRNLCVQGIHGCQALSCSQRISVQYLPLVDGSKHGQWTCHAQGNLKEPTNYVGKLQEKWSTPWAFLSLVDSCFDLQAQKKARLGGVLTAELMVRGSLKILKIPKFEKVKYLVPLLQKVKYLESPLLQKVKYLESPLLQTVLYLVTMLKILKSEKVKYLDPSYVKMVRTVRMQSQPSLMIRRPWHKTLISWIMSWALARAPKKGRPMWTLPFLPRMWWNGSTMSHLYNPMWMGKSTVAGLWWRSKGISIAKSSNVRAALVHSWFVIACAMFWRTTMQAGRLEAPLPVAFECTDFSQEVPIEKIMDALQTHVCSSETVVDSVNH